MVVVVCDTIALDCGLERISGGPTEAVRNLMAG